VNRRRLLRVAIGVGMSACGLPLWAQAPSVNMRRVGVLAPSTQAKEEVTLKPFFDEMRQLGWVEGQNIVYDRAYADDRHQDLPRLAAELVARNPELIYAPPQPAAVAARRATRTIPIVFATGTDPVGAGLVSSLAHPGGNATGVVNVVDSLAPKRVELLRQILPGAKRIGLLGDPTDPRLAHERGVLVPVASALGLTIVVGEASNPVEFDAAVAKLIGQGVDVIFATTSITLNLRGRLIDLANRKRVPVVGGLAALAESGALFTYGASLADQFRRSAQLADKVLKGAQPADIPVEQPTKFELVINLKTAKALGLTISQSLLVRADEVIQ
jgi:putative ABC transport system substrate-binding protein